MPAAKPPEFRRRAVELARAKDKPVAQIASDLGIAESCLRRWMKLDDVEVGRVEGVTSDERAELVRLRRENRVQTVFARTCGSTPSVTPTSGTSWASAVSATAPPVAVGTALSAPTVW